MRTLLAAFLLGTTACSTPVIEPGPIVGAQLYTVRESMAADPLATLRRVADLGVAAYGSGGCNRGNQGAMQRYTHSRLVA